MIIGGVVSQLRLAPLGSVLYVALFGNTANVMLRVGCSYDVVKFPEGSLQLSEETEDTPSGVVYSTELTGQLSPVCAEHSVLLERYRITPFICVVVLKSGATILVGDMNIACTLSSGKEVSADYSTNAYNVSISCRNTHECYFVDAF
jgi:hypothetical protein